MIEQVLGSRYQNVNFSHGSYVSLFTGATMIFADFQEQPETMELFLTDFQLRLLWGSRGATENQALRYAKFDQVLTALSNKLEPPVKHTDP